MKYYVYIINKEKTWKNAIAFALSCPDERTGKWVCEKANRKVHFNSNSSYKCGVIGVDRHVTIEFKEKPGAWKQPATTKCKNFIIEDFEEAETETKKLLSESKNEYYDCNLEFMRFVDKALRELTVAAEPVYPPIIPHPAIPRPMPVNIDFMKNTELRNLTGDLIRHKNLMGGFLSAINKPVESPVAESVIETKPKDKRQRIQKALSELIETDSFIRKIKPLPKYDNPNSKWITSQSAATNLEVAEGYLSNLRTKNECVTYKEEEYAGFIIGRSDNGLIWCKSGKTSKTIFYLLSEIQKRKKK